MKYTTAENIYTENISKLVTGYTEYIPRYGEITEPGKLIINRYINPEIRDMGMRVSV